MHGTMKNNCMFIFKINSLKCFINMRKKVIIHSHSHFMNTVSLTVTKQFSAFILLENS